MANNQYQNRRGNNTQYSNQNRSNNVNNGNEGKPKKTLVELMEDMKPEIAKALPQHLSPERMIRLSITACRNNPKLLECDPMTFISAVVQASQLGLEPNTPLGEAYLIPYKGSVQFQIGYRGYLTLAYRTGQYKRISAHEVYENDHFEYRFGTNAFLNHTPADEPYGEPVKYYAVYELLNGGYDFRVWTRKQALEHATKYSNAKKNGWTSPWDSDFDGMAKKTVVKDLLNYAPKSVEFTKAFASDESIKKGISENMEDVIDMRPEVLAEPSEQHQVQTK